MEEKTYIMKDGSEITEFKVVDGELHFLDCFSKEWEAFCFDYKDVLTHDQMKTLKKELGEFTMYKTPASDEEGTRGEIE